MAANPSAMAALRDNRVVVYSVVGAAIAVAVCALVAIAWMLGWLPGPPSAAQGSAPTGQRTAAAPSAETLDPGETVVAPADKPKRPEPLMPTYSPPTPPAPAPAAEAPPPRKPARAPAPPVAHAPVTNPDAPPTSPTEPQRQGHFEPYVNRDPSRPGPAVPSFARNRDRPAQAEAGPRAPATCSTCGTVSAITTYPGLWDVRVRLDEGGTQTFRFRIPPPFHIGERVRTEGGRLAHERLAQQD